MNSAPKRNDSSPRPTVPASTNARLAEVVAELRKREALRTGKLPGWTPLPMQSDALACEAYELLVGGCAGPGKSEFLVVDPLRWTGHKAFRAILFRNTFEELERSLISKARRLYPPLGATYHESRHIWTFPSGAQIGFSYLEREKDVHRYQGGEWQYLGFDELPHFTDYQYCYLSSRLRSSSGLPVRIRATANPDGPHLEWVRRRWALWIDKAAGKGDVRWFDPDGGLVEASHPDALSRSYIPGYLRDNPYLSAEYRKQLMALDPVTRAKLLDGDWDAVVGEGKLFHRDWWAYLDNAPACVKRCRGWDLGAGGDATVGVLIGDRGASVVPRWVVLDVVRHVGPPHEVHDLIAKTAARDGRDVLIRLPQDPGQAGKDQALAYRRELAGYTVITKPVTGDKTVRAGGWSSQVGAQNAALVRAPWNAAYVAEHHAFPDATHEDAVDASADAFGELVITLTPTYTDRPRPHLKTRL